MNFDLSFTFPSEGSFPQICLCIPLVIDAAVSLPLADVECIIADADSRVSTTHQRQTVYPAQLEFGSSLLHFTALILQWEGSSKSTRVSKFPRIIHGIYTFIICFARDFILISINKA